ncbi:unnamed protein product [Ceutorhynchus assimilis]|uniref:Uncharacterized protein n=1 Tax=Ceutorhynchus assimilis TaxID=467358 RepID=A0A9N9QQW5_9CUCU|nr:unnamed protein product [Ceutorhynchus assimilis]
MPEMRPRYYVHMGPKVPEKVSVLWKVTHITLYFLLLCSSGVATACIYNILDMYKFHCILYAKIHFEQSYEERVKEMNETKTQEEQPVMINMTTNEIPNVSVDCVQNPDDPACQNITTIEPKKGRELETETETIVDCIKNPNDPACQSTTIMEQKKGGELETENEKIADCIKNPDDPACQHTTIMEQEKGTELEIENKTEQEPDFPSLIIPIKLDDEKEWKVPINDTPWNGVNITGFLNMRKTIFATIYFCDLMLFAPLASIVLAIFLGTLVVVGGKGGAGNPGDLLPNPWICVYPFLGLCCFMTVFSFIADSIFHKGLAAFCLRYYTITKQRSCSKKMDQFNIQYTPDRLGPARPFYKNFMIGSIGVQMTTALWVIQTLIYVLRILFLADFQLYLTKIQLKDDITAKEPQMGNVVMEMIMESKRKKN